MENIGKPTPSEARFALDDIDRVQRAVRDTPWPVWLYPVNALLIGAMALAPLLSDPARFVALVALAAAIVGVNTITGYRMGTPWALPTNRTFQFSVILCAVFVVASVAFTPPTWPTVLLAIAASITYSIGAFAHYRSTSR
ncbi:hypothetical protein [Rhodococcus sp. MALMAid1271]|uniref:hypothetical protein n=1 Tax=Rhodococcus sp. MALMAid1271 TaxID=3411744 RepID=UPI003BA0EBB6